MAPTVIYTEPSGCTFQSWYPKGIHALASLLHQLCILSWGQLSKLPFKTALIWRLSFGLALAVSLLWYLQSYTLLEEPGRIWGHVNGQAMKTETIPGQPFHIQILNINWLGLGRMGQFVALPLVSESLQNSSKTCFIKWKNTETVQ